jgi:uncharacterized repeat protein (TIGR03803 family)
MRVSSIPAAIAAAIVSAGFAVPAHAARQTILYSFTGNADGGFPEGGLIADASGNFYGTTTSDGTGHNGVVFELSPPAPGKTAWTQTTLYTFKGGKDGGIPQAALTLDTKGALYGTTYAGGNSSANDGVVFKLIPPSKGKTAWTENVLWTFSGGNDGSEPTSSLILDAAGNVYGTTTGGGTGVVGTVFELTPPGAGGHAWTETVLYNFTGNADGGEPYGNMLFGQDGNLYGTSAAYGDNNNGTIFRLVAPASQGGAWNFGLLHAFSGKRDGQTPRDGLIQGSDGTLYGTTAGFDGYGNVFSLKPDGSAYFVIYTVPGLPQDYTGAGPWRTVSMDASGALWGATLADGKNSAGTVFKLTPPASGKTAWGKTVVHRFQQGASGQFAYTTVLIGKGVITGTTMGAGSQSGFFPGTVWQIAD